MLTLTKGPLARLDAAWMACASSSLPVPVSAQQQHRALRLRGTPRLALDLGRCGAGADEAGKGVFGAALSIPRHGQRAAALAGQLAPGIVQVALQQRKLADEGLQRGLGWSNSTMPMAPITRSASSRSGMRLTTKVPACW